MTIYCLAAVDRLLREYIASSIYPTHVEWYDMLLSSYLLSPEGRDYDVVSEAGRWARGIRKIPVQIRRYYATRDGQTALADTIRQRYIPYVMDLRRLAQRMDEMIGADTTLSTAIREHLNGLYPCDGPDGYSIYIAQALICAMDRLPD